MTIKSIKNIAKIGNYSINGFEYTCDKCGVVEKVPQKGIGNVITSVPDDWVYVQQLAMDIKSHYCRACGIEIGIGC